MDVSFHIDVKRHEPFSTRLCGIVTVLKRRVENGSWRFTSICKETYPKMVRGVSHQLKMVRGVSHQYAKRHINMKRDIHFQPVILVLSQS